MFQAARLCGRCETIAVKFLDGFESSFVVPSGYVIRTVFCFSSACCTLASALNLNRQSCVLSQCHHHSIVYVIYIHKHTHTRARARAHTHTHTLCDTGKLSNLSRLKNRHFFSDIFRGVRKNCQKRPLAQHVSAWNKRIFTKFYIGAFFENISRKFKIN